MNRTYTIEQLENAIRTASSLDELRRMVGPSSEQEDVAVKRLDRIDRIGARYEFDEDRMPARVRGLYRQLWSEQNDYEAKFC